MQTKPIQRINFLKEKGFPLNNLEIYKYATWTNMTDNLVKHTMDAHLQIYSMLDKIVSESLQSINSFPKVDRLLTNRVLQHMVPQ